MRSKTLSSGLILLVVGVYVIYGGSGLIKSLAFLTATVSLKTEVQEPILLTVDANGFQYVTIPVSLDNLRSLHASYAADGNVNFYVMDQMEFDSWRSGKPTAIQVSVLSAKNASFTLIPTQEKTYYFVFDNRASNRITSLILSLSGEKTVTETNPAVPYLPHSLIIIGVALIWFGLKGKRRTKPPETGTPRKESPNINPQGLADDEL